MEDYSRIRPPRKAVSGSAHADCGRIPAIMLLARARQVCPPERARKPEPAALEGHSPFPSCFQVTHLKILVFQWFSCFRHGVAITPEPHMPTCLRFWKQTLHRLKVRLPFRRIPESAADREHGKRSISARRNGTCCWWRERHRSRETKTRRNPAHHPLLAFR